MGRREQCSARSIAISPSKSVEGLKAPVDRREPQERDLVEGPQRPEDRQADFVRGDLGRPGGPDLLLDPLGQQRQVVLGHRPALAGLADAGEHLVAAERLGGAGALDHRQEASRPW